jgi:dihydrofolate synthase/folylpolyglutamate synthase
VAGSKGKGSTATMVAAILQAAGERVGLYTSPHLHRFTERIAIDGEPVAREEFGRLAGDVAPAIEAEEAEGSFGAVSTFEALTAMAFLAFREHDATAQVLEVGLGGRLDATNVLDSKEVCLITPIGLEHTAVLGDTIEQIAGEKAAIITDGATVVMAPQREPAADVVRKVCAERGAKLLEVAQVCAMRRERGSGEAQEFTVRTPDATHRLRLPLLGKHQLDNAATAVLAAEALDAPEAAIRQGLAELRWPGRIEIIKRRPLVIVDGAHDRDSTRRLASTLRDDLGVRQATLVVGTLSDKDVAGMAAEVAPLATKVIAPLWQHPRVMPPADVAAAFANAGVAAEHGAPLEGTLDAALEESTAVVAFGSIAFAGQVRQHVLAIEPDPPLAAPAKQEAVV